jgi:hypothetical protein
MDKEQGKPFYAGLGEQQGAPPVQRASADGRGGAAALRLDNRTYLDSGHYSVIIRDYGEGLAEIGWSFVPSRNPNKAGKGDSTDRAAHEDRAVRRARSRLRQLILASGVTHLLTLTYRANVTAYDQACDDLSRFVRRLRSRLPGWIYVAVAEQQKRGAWHWHMAVKGRQDVKLLRAEWLGIVGAGNIDVKPPRDRKANRRLALVRYLGKYLAKTFESNERALNAHRYRATRGIAIPHESIIVPGECRGEVAQYVISQFHQRVGAVGFVWVDPQGTAGWACSW